MKPQPAPPPTGARPRIAPSAGSSAPPATEKPAKKSRLILDFIVWAQSRRPDRSPEGFDAACDVAMEFVAQYDWHTIAALQKQIADIVARELRAGSVHVDYVATHKSTRKPRLEIQTDWGLWAAYDIGVNVDGGRPRA